MNPFVNSHDAFGFDELNAALPCLNGALVALSSGDVERAATDLFDIGLLLGRE
jgi:hypothetical protein